MNRHIAFVAPFGLRQKSTVWARTLPLARTLAAQGWTPTIVIPPWDSPADAGRTWQDQGVRLVNVSIRGGVAATTHRLLRELAHTAPEIVHVVKPRAHAGLVQWWLWQRRRVGARSPYLFLDTDDWEQAWAPINRYAWLLARFLAWQEEWGIRHADGITAASRWLTAHVALAAPATPRLHLPNGVATPAPDAPRWVSASGCDVLFFSRFVEVSPVWLAAFWRALHTRRPHARLLIAGAPIRPDLADAFRQTMDTDAPAAANAVEWVGYVNQADLPALYARIGCAIFPAEPTVLQQAKCSVRLATTLLAGAPVVASAVGEQVGYGGAGAARLVPASATPEEFATAVDAVLAAPDAQRALSATARQHLLASYAWERLGAQLDRFYLEVIGKG